MLRGNQGTIAEHFLQCCDESGGINRPAFVPGVDAEVVGSPWLGEIAVILYSVKGLPPHGLSVLQVNGQDNGFGLDREIAAQVLEREPFPITMLLLDLLDDCFVVVIANRSIDDKTNPRSAHFE